MPNFRIFTESKDDIKFIKDYIEEVFSVTLENSDFDTLNSWSGYKAGGKLKASIEENNLNEKQTILILDADSSFQIRNQEILTDFATYGIPVQLFLFPDNSNSGNIEILLATIAADHRLMDCFLKYEECVNAYPKKLNDSRIYSYLDMLLHDNPKDENGKDLRKDEYRNYRNPAHWNLNHEYLQPLKHFLSPFFAS